MASEIERRIAELTERIESLTEKRDKLVAAWEVLREESDGTPTVISRASRARSPHITMSMTTAIANVIREAGGGPVSPTEMVRGLLRTPEYRRRDPKQLAKAVADRLSRRRNVFRRVRKGRYTLVESRPAPATGTISEQATYETTADIITDEVTRHPGATTSEIADRVVRRAHIVSDDPRRVVLTRIGQLVKGDRLLKDDDRRLFLPGHQLELHAGSNGHP